MIPKIIHQTYRIKNIPDRFNKILGLFFILTGNKDFGQMKIVMILLALIFIGFIERVDAFRYFLLYHEGGIYVDLDCEARRSIETLLLGKDIILGKEPDNYAKQLYNIDFLVSNAFMCSIPRHLFWPIVFEELEKSKEIHNVLKCTGPLLLNNAYQKYEKKDITITDEQQFIWGKTESKKINAKTYVIHWNVISYETNDNNK